MVRSRFVLLLLVAVRTYAARYLARLGTVIPFGSAWAVRITSGGNAEMLYPGGGSYWAFDRNALGGPDLPQGLAANPYPTWRPGAGGLTPAQVGSWLNWYIGALANEAGWQANAVSALGFRGYFQFVTPGLGMLPGDYAKAIAMNIPDGLLGVGAAWERFYALLPIRTNAVAYLSSMADGSGSNTGCAAGDARIPLTSSVTTVWSAARWLARVASVNGMLVGGENPGFGGSLSRTYRDAGATGMAATTAMQARTCGFQVVYWAHDDQVWDGTFYLQTHSRWMTAAG